MEEELSPQQAERVRRLLADARHTDPVPADVVARIDRVLADLATEPAARPGADPPVGKTDGAGVVRLDERRRKVRRLLLVAAAVAVGGVAVGQVVDGTGGRSESATDAADAGSEGALPAPQRESAAAGEDESGELSDGDQAGPGAVAQHQRSISRQPAQRVRSDRFALDAQRLQAVATGRRSAPDEAAVSGAGTCAPGAWGGGRYLRVTFDRDAGWLVYRPPRGDTQVVDLFLCGEETPERSATLADR